MWIKKERKSILLILFNSIDLFCDELNVRLILWALHVGLHFNHDWGTCTDASWRQKVLLSNDSIYQRALSSPSSTEDTNQDPLVCLQVTDFVPVVKGLS